MSLEATIPDSDVDSASDSSTLVYDHETFETFQGRVLKLCQTIPPFSNIDNNNISIERMRGGSFNRIIGVTVTSRESSTVNQYVLRVPRFEFAQLDHDLAPLQLLSQHSRIRTPDTIAFDTARGNVLEDPYMILTRLPGTPLISTYPDMPHDMRCAIAKELGETFAELHSIRSVIAGKPTLSPSQDSVMVQPFHTTAPDAAVPYENGPGQQAISDMLRTLLEHNKELAVANGPTDFYRVPLFDSFITIASEMEALGFLDGNSYCLCHLDLEPHNILARQPSSSHSHAITGILDWDSSLFTPLFMSCAPPMWLWAWNDDDDEDERLADNTPPTPKLCELKQLFEDAAGLTYRQYAYGAQYRLARKLIWFAVHGLRSNEDFKGAEMLQTEWAEVQASLRSAKTSTITTP